MPGARTIISLAASMASMAAFGQDATGFRHSFSTEVFQSAMRHFQVRGYRCGGRVSFGLHAGYRPTFGDRTNIREMVGLFSGHTLNNHFNGVYQAVTAGPIIRYHLGKDRRGFLEMELLYRHWWYHRRYVAFDGWSSQFEGIRTERQNVYAVKLLWGGYSLTRLRVGPGGRVLFEGFGGIGWRWKDMAWTMHEGTLNGEDMVEVSGGRSWWLPSAHMGIRVGVGFRARPSDGGGP